MSTETGRTGDERVPPNRELAFEALLAGEAAGATRLNDVQRDLCQSMLDASRAQRAKIREMEEGLRKIASLSDRYGDPAAGANEAMGIARELLGG